TPPCTQARCEYAASVDRAPEIDAHDPLPVFHRSVFDPLPAQTDAGIVDDDLRIAAEPDFGLLGEFLDILELRDVAFDRPCLAARARDFSDGLLGRLGLEVGADDAA